MPGEVDTFVLHKRILLKQEKLAKFNKVTMEYFFKSFTGEPEPKSLIFTMKDMVFELDINSEKIIPIHEFKDVNMDLPPIHFECTDDQQKFVIASMYDGIWVNS